MLQIFKPTRLKIVIFFGILAFIFLIFFVGQTINEREITYPVLPLLLAGVYVSSALTGGFRCETFCFPSIPQAFIIVLVDVFLIYLLSCIISLFIRRRKN